MKVVKLQGEFVCHEHKDEDGLFLVLRGSFRMEFGERSVELSEGEFLIVPRGVEHRPVEEEVGVVMLFGRAQIKDTGDVESELTVREWDWV